MPLWRSISAWYRRPEQELLRREVAWLRRWIRRPGPAAAIALFVALMALAQFFDALFASELAKVNYIGIGSPKWIFLSSLSSDAALGLAAWIILHLVCRRGLAPLRPGRIEAIAVTPLGSRELWPGLLGAPLAAAPTLAVAQFAALFLAQIGDAFWGSGGTGWLRLAVPPESFSPWMVELFESVQKMDSATSSLGLAAWLAALAAFAASISPARRGGGRAMGAAVIALALVSPLPQMLALLFGSLDWEAGRAFPSPIWTEIFPSLGLLAGWMGGLPHLAVAGAVWVWLARRAFAKSSRARGRAALAVGAIALLALTPRVAGYWAAIPINGAGQFYGNLDDEVDYLQFVVFYPLARFGLALLYFWLGLARLRQTRYGTEN